MTILDVPFPRVLRIEPASQCNLACIHCPTGTVDMSRGLMPEAIEARALQELRDNIDAVRVVVLYHGGEPLLNTRIYQLIRRIKEIESSLFVKSVTNGMALNAANATKLVESGIDAVEISLDGLSASESQYIRRNSDTRKIVENVKGLISARNQLGSRSPTVHLATTQFIRSKQVSFPIPSAQPPAWLLEEFRDTVGYKATYGVLWPHMKIGSYELLRAPPGLDKAYCDHVVSTITIRSDGDVVACCYDLTSKLVMGNITSESLRTIWNGERYRSLRASISDQKFQSICGNCAVVKPPIYLIPRLQPAITVVAK